MSTYPNPNPKHFRSCADQGRLFTPMSFLPCTHHYPFLAHALTYARAYQRHPQSGTISSFLLPIHEAQVLTLDMETRHFTPSIKALRIGLLFAFCFSIILLYYVVSVTRQFRQNYKQPWYYYCYVGFELTPSYA